MKRQDLIAFAEDKTGIRDEPWDFIGSEVVDELGTEENYLSCEVHSIKVMIKTRADTVVDVSILSIGEEDEMDMLTDDDDSYLDEEMDFMSMGM